MKIKSFEKEDKNEVINLIGKFRVRTAQLKGIEKGIDLKNANEELEFYIKKKIPNFHC